MQPLDAQDLVLNMLVVLIMPPIIWANLKDMGSKSPLHTYLWREHANFMRACLVIIALLTADAAVTLLAHFGVIRAAVAQIAIPVLGIAFLIAAVAMIWLTGAAVVKLVGNWRYGQSQTNGDVGA
jgi:hypothetical protein